MYNYKIGYHSYEECPDITLQHDDKFSRNDIETMLAEYIKTRKDLPNKKYTFYNNLSDIIFETGNNESFIKFLCEIKGFKRMKYECSYSEFGWADVFDKEDWKEDRDGLNSLTDRLYQS